MTGLEGAFRGNQCQKPLQNGNSTFDFRGLAQLTATNSLQRLRQEAVNAASEPRLRGGLWTELLGGISVVGETIGPNPRFVVIAKIHTIIHSGFHRHKHGHPSSDHFHANCLINLCGNQ